MYKFIGRESWRDTWNSEELTKNLRKATNQNVTVLRGVLFFHAEEKTTLERLRIYFTEEAIGKLAHDEFIKIHD